MSTGTLQEARLEIVDMLKTAEIGLREVPSKIPANAKPFPFAVPRMGSGYFEIQSARIKGMHNIVIEIHVKRLDIGRNYDKLEKLTQDVAHHLSEKHKNREFTKLEHWDRIVYDLQPSVWAEVETLAVILLFENVKVWSDF